MIHNCRAPATVNGAGNGGKKKFMKYIIVQHKKITKGININGARLYEIVEGRAKEVLTFRHATAKGWKSNKPILVDFSYIENINDYQGSALEISEDVAIRLIKTYHNVATKVFNTWKSDNKAGVILALCEHMHDPYDRG